VYEGNWGEQLTSRSYPVICVLDIESGVVSTLENLPDDVSPGQVRFRIHAYNLTYFWLYDVCSVFHSYVCETRVQAVWCPGDTGIVCVGWYNEAYRLGLIYCPTRRPVSNAVYLVDCTIN
jgi:acylaminoacyl-peptidase